MFPVLSLFSCYPPFPQVVLKPHFQFDSEDGMSLLLMIRRCRCVLSQGICIFSALFVAATGTVSAASSWTLTIDDTTSGGAFANTPTGISYTAKADNAHASA